MLIGGTLRNLNVRSDAENRHRTCPIQINARPGVTGRDGIRITVVPGEPETFSTSKSIRARPILTSPQKDSPTTGRSDFPTTGRLAAFDFGTVRIGVALCDPDWILASPHCVLNNAPYHSAASDYVGLVADESIVGIVVGLPLHADGNESPSSRLAREFAAWIADQTGLPVRMFDERFTTVDAANRLRGGGQSRKKKQKRIDAVAATVLLESFLEASRYRGEVAGSDPLSFGDDAGDASSTTNKNASENMSIDDEA